MGKTSEFLKKMLNPLPSEGFDTDWKKSPQNLELEKYKNKQLIRHAGRNLLGWGAAMFAIRMALGQAGKLKQKKSDKEIRNYLNARYPVVSLDPDLEDKEKEKIERSAGLEKLSEEADNKDKEDEDISCDTPGAKIRSGGKGRGKAVGKGKGPIGIPVLAKILAGLENKEDKKEDKEAAEKTVDKAYAKISGKHRGSLNKLAAEKVGPVGEAWRQAQDFIGTLGRKDRANLHLAATLAASYGGGVLGYKLADKLLARQRGAELDTKIDKNRNEMDRLMYEEYLRTRGLNKNAREKETVPSSSMWNALGSAWWVWAVGSMALAYSMSKKFVDERDPARQRFKELKEVAKDMSKQREQPMLINETDFNPVQTKGSLKPKKSAATGNVALPKKKAEKKEVDKRDPYADILS